MSASGSAHCEPSSSTTTGKEIPASWSPPAPQEERERESVCVCVCVCVCVLTCVRACVCVYVHRNNTIKIDLAPGKVDLHRRKYVIAF